MPPFRRMTWLALSVCGMIMTSSASSAFTSTPNNASAVNNVPVVHLSPETDSKAVKVVQSYGLRNEDSTIQQVGINPIYPPSINFAPQTKSPGSYNTSKSGSHYGSQPNSFIPSQFMGYKPNPVRHFRPSSIPGTQNKPKYAHPVPNAQRRDDSDMGEDEGYNEEEEYEREEYRREMEQEDHANDDLGYDDHYHYSATPPPPKEGEQPPETRESPFAGFPVSGPGFVGPAPFDPLPPPPQSIKGSVDYILIPLVLIGLAGPIFVVLYVILGAFEAKLSPITRSLGGIDAYRPYLDNLMSTVGRALDTHECLDYAACQFGTYYNHLGYADTYPTILKTMGPFMPEPAKRRMRALFNSIKNRESCSIQNCIRFQSLSNP